MKVARTFTFAEHERQYNNCVVAIDAHHRATLGLGMLGTNCEITSDPTQKSFQHAQANSLDYILVDSRPDHFIQFLQVINDDLGSSPTRVHLAMPSATFVSTFNFLAQASAANCISAAAVLLNEEMSVLTLQQECDGDYAADQFLVGFHTGLKASGYSISPLPESPDEFRRTRLKLLSLLETLPQLQAPAEAADNSTQLAYHSSATGSDGSSIEILEKRLIASTAQLDALQRKYDSLANSTLGKLTLQRWARKRKGKL